MSHPRVTLVHKHFNTLSDDVMRRKLLKLLRSVGWDVKAAAEEVGLTRQRLYKIINGDQELFEAIEARRDGRRYATQKSA